MTPTTPVPPDAMELDSIRHVVSHLEGLEETLAALDADRFGPDFAKARDMAYAARRYLEIELTQYGDATDGMEDPF